MNGLTVLQQNDTQELARLGDPRPFAYSSVRLNLGLLGVLHHVDDPLIADRSAVRPLPPDRSCGKFSSDKPKRLTQHPADPRPIS